MAIRTSSFIIIFLSAFRRLFCSCCYHSATALNSVYSVVNFNDKTLEKKKFCSMCDGNNNNEKMKLKRNMLVDFICKFFLVLSFVFFFARSFSNFVNWIGNISCRSDQWFLTKKHYTLLWMWKIKSYTDDVVLLKLKMHIIVVNIHTYHARMQSSTIYGELIGEKKTENFFFVQNNLL